ncbi:SprT family zinc-dependent metalloprotease [Rhizobium sp. RM]|uniref:M48 family metallopeptidase n=1 Tax=Rhizobium sp. RM TaxID=2748079 RepID=UPI00110EB56F|nr:SprT family zinc-dependent metalloprotease [Rhizobium sp. RM]NWJ23120.1 M48 family metallopeptidase [Rhizobium sp. RM]TMV14008.1 M48 family metallopeptidase [Rhizobium sp. Td3]
MFSLLRKSVKSTAPKRAVQSQRTVEVAGRSLPITVKENPRATRITLRIEPGGRALKLTIPFGLHHGQVDDFLERHHGWLEGKLGKIGPDNGLRPGATIEIRGVPHRIEHTGSVRGITRMSEDADGVAILSVSGLPEHLGRRISAFLKKEAKADLEKLVMHHARSVGRPVRSITMKDTRSRWGSCSHDGNLSFSWRIVMAPEKVIDYLAAHEVAHLAEMNHGPKFWALCEKLCPHTEEAKAWLKRHGSQLHAVDFD